MSSIVKNMLPALVLILLHVLGASAEPPQGKEAPAKKDEPKSAQKEPEVLTPEEAIKQRGEEKVTVQFKVAAVKMGWSTGRVPKGSKTSPCWFELGDGNNFSVVLKGGPTYRLERLGIDAIRHFEGKVVRVTGRVLGEKPPFSIGVDDLDQFEVVLRPFTKEEQRAPKADPKESRQKPAKDEKMLALFDQIVAFARKEKHPRAGTGPWEAKVTEFRVVDKFDDKLFEQP